MSWILIGMFIFVGMVLLIIFSRAGSRDIDEEASKEATQASPEELNRALHPPQKTKEEVEIDNDLYEER